jgi:hypothetical protein
MNFYIENKRNNLLGDDLMRATTAYAFAWVATAVAVSMAIYITRSASPLWAMLIPACISFSSSDKKE